MTEAGDGPAAGPDNRPEPPGRDRPLRVLVVEDDLVNRLALTGLLRRHGHDATACPDGLDAVARLGAGEPYDVVLLDLRLPGLGGAEVARELRRLEAGTGRGRAAVFAVTALSWQARERRDAAPHVDGFVTKPYAYEVIEALVRAVRRPGRSAS
jgi:CheY-like chemotaxis protein